MKRIMLVDDYSSILKLTKTILEIQGYDVQTYDNGSEALEILKAYPNDFDILITDLGMPKYNGFKLINDIRNYDIICKIIVITGFTSKILEEEGIKDKISGFLQKPFTVDQLKVAVEKAMKE